MDRLTGINKCGEVFRTSCEISDSDAWEKLAEYEEMEEKGLLVKLPYPVGTQLFIPCRKQGVKQDNIRRWQTNNKGLMFCSNGSFYLADAIGKSVFLTMEEAENKLNEMKNNCDDCPDKKTETPKKKIIQYKEVDGYYEQYIDGILKHRIKKPILVEPFSIKLKGE